MKSRILSTTGLSFSLACALAALLAASAAHAADGTWLGVDGNWNDGATWNGGNIADGSGFTANFTDIDTEADKTITLTGPQTIGNITFTDATTASHNLTISGANTLTLAGTPGINVTDTGRTLTISSVVDGTAGLNKTGTGILTLSAANTYTGTTTATQGLLKLDNPTALPGGIGTSGGTGNLAFSGGVIGLTADFSRSTGTGVHQVQWNSAGGGFAAFKGDRSVNFNGAGAGVTWSSGGGTTSIGGIMFLSDSTATHTVTIVNPINFNNGTKTVSVADGTAAVDAVLSGVLSNGRLAKSGLGTLALTGVNTYSHTNSTTVNAGTLSISGAGSLGSGTYAPNISIVTGATFNYNSSAAQTLSGIISGGGVITKTGAGSLTLSGANTYSGTTTVSTGTLTLTHALSVQNSALVTTGAGTVTLSGVTTPTFGGLSGATGDLATVISSGYSGITALTLNPGTGAVTYGGVIANGAGTMTLTKIGLGTQILSGANSYGGATTISAGTLALGASNTLPDTAVAIGSATLDAVTFTDTLGTLVTTGTAIINLDTGAALAFADSSGIPWTGTLKITGDFVSEASLRFGDGTGTGLSTTQLTLISLPGYTFSLNPSGYLKATANIILPTLVGIGDNSTGGIVEKGTIVTYTVTFDMDMDHTTVTAADFGNEGTANITVGTISETTPGVFTIQVTPTTTGTLQLKINQDAELRNVASNALDTSAAIFDLTTLTAIDTTPPTLTSIFDNKGGASVTVGTLVTYTVTFSEDIDSTTVTDADFVNAGSAAITINSVYETTPTSGIFTVLATPTTIGTLQLQVPISAEIKDLTALVLNTSVAISDDTTLAVVDTTAYWDLDGSMPGAGGANPIGTWDGVTANWNTTADGSGTTNTWAAGQAAVFASGTDASGSYTITVSGTRDISGLTFEDGTVTLTGGTALRLVANSTADVAAGLTATIATVISQNLAGQALSKTGDGTLILSGTSVNTYSGGTTIITGKVIAQSKDAALGTAAVAVASGATLQLNNNLGQDVTLAIANTITGAGTLEFTAADIPYDNGTTWDRNRVSVGNLSGFTGDIHILANGNFSYANANATTNQNLTIDAGGFLQMGTISTNGFGALNGAGTITRNSGSGSTSMLTVGNGDASGTFNGVIRGANDATFDTAGLRASGRIALTKKGTGTQTLSNANLYGGATLISAGILKLSHSLAMQNSVLDTAGSIAGGPASGLQTTVPTLTLGGLTGDKDLVSVFTTVAGGYDTVTALTLNPATGSTASYSGIIADGAPGMSLTKTSTGTQTLSGANAYSGNTTVTGGTLTLSGAASPTDANTGNNASTVTIADLGATLNLTYTGTDKVAKLFIGASQKAPGVYGHTNSGATNGVLGLGALDAYFGPGTGTLTVGGNYASWANDPLKGNIPGEPASGDFDKDGISNFIEYALGKDPRASSQPAGALVGNDIIFTKGADAIANGDVSWVIETSETLSDGSWAPQVTQPAADPALTISFTFTPSTPPKNFARLKVTGP